MNCITKNVLLSLSLTTLWSVNALALPPIPPPEAYTACEDKQAGEQASFTSPKGHDISGVCEQHEDGRLVLRPDNMGRGNRSDNTGRGRSIPQAAYQNCAGKQAGDTVQITTRTGKIISGTCQSDGDKLYLRPDSSPGMKSHSGNRSDGNSDFNKNQPPRNRKGNSRSTPPEAAYRACEGKTAGQEVQMTTPQGRTITGTCEEEGDRLFLRSDRSRSGHMNGNGFSGSKGQQKPQQFGNKGNNGKSTPPEAAYRACEGKTAGEEVQMTGPQGKTITGECVQDGERLYLRVEQHRRQSADITPVESSTNEPEEQLVQQPQEEESTGFLDGVKSFWNDLW